MITQVQDLLQYVGEEYGLVAFSNGEPFSPADAGYQPVTASTICRRGYMCVYLVKHGVLQLNDLRINHQPGDVPATRRLPPPHLNGVAAVRNERSFYGAWHYRSVGLRLAYTGGLVIGRDFMHGLAVHPGFHTAWKFQHVYELTFEQGKLVEARDASPGTSRLRTRIRHRLKPGFEATQDQIKEWNSDCFRHNYCRDERGDQPRFW